MALIPRDKLTELIPAVDAKSTADSAIDEINLQIVAAAINNAANTGEYKTLIQGEVTQATLDQLSEKGYEVVHYTNPNLASYPTLIKWGKSDDTEGSDT